MKICPITGLKMSVVAGGRVAVYVPEHPKANNRGYILRYRYLMENKLGRRLRPDEEVHHKNENPIDDEIWNLEVLPIGVHTALHRSGAAGNRKNDYRLIEQMMSEGCGCRKISKRTKIPLGSVKYAMKAIRLKTGA